MVKKRKENRYYMEFQSPLLICASGLSNSGHVCVSCFKIEMDLILFLPQKSGCYWWLNHPKCMEWCNYPQIRNTFKCLGVIQSL